jgi:hypothetical protein
MAEQDAAEIFRRYLTVHARFDFTTCRAMLAPDARIYYNYRSVDQTFSVAEAYSTIEGMVSWLRSMRFAFDRPFISTPTQFALQTTAHAVTRGGAALTTPVVYMGRVDGQGLITEYQEFLDPAAMAPLFAEMQGAGA